MKSINTVVASLALVVPVGLFAAVEPSDTQAKAISVLANQPSVNISGWHKEWSTQAGGAIKAIRAEQSLTNDTKAALIAFVSASNSQYENPFATTKKYRSINKEVLIDSEWVRAVGPLTETLAQFKVVEAIPAIVERYFDGESYSSTKREIFYGALGFRDIRFVPVFNHYLNRTSLSEYDWDVIKLDVAPVAFEGLKSEDEFIRTQSQDLLNLIKSKNIDPEVQAACEGRGPVRNPNRITVVERHNDRIFLRELPIDKNFQSVTQQDLAMKGTQIGELKEGEVRLANAHKDLDDRFNANKTEVASKLADQGTQIAGLTTRVGASETEIAAAKARVEKQEALVALMKADYEAAVAQSKEKGEKMDVDIAKAASRIAELEKQLGGMRTELARLNSAKSEGESTMADYKAPKKQPNQN